MNKVKLFLCFFGSFLCCTQDINAQTWKWGVRGGSAFDEITDTRPIENVISMTTDVNGNIYMLSPIYNESQNIDGHIPVVYGEFTEANLALVSFTCDGAYRWCKIMGGWDGALWANVKVDNYGGVYIGTSFDYFNYDYPVHISTDTIMPYSFREMTFIKYDTSGNFKWIRTPQSDTVTIAGDEAWQTAYDMDVDSKGNSYYLCILTPGQYGGSFTVDSDGIYIVKYDSSGTLQQILAPQISFSGSNIPWSLYLKKDEALNRFYVTGILQGVYMGGLLLFANDTIVYPLFIGAFTDSGKLIWQRQNQMIGVGNFFRPDIDAAHNIYLAGASSNGDNFNGFTVTNTIEMDGSVPFVVKLDTNGNNLWAINASDNNAASGAAGIAVNGDEVGIVGYYPGTLSWPGYPDSLNLHHVPDQGYDIFTTRFNATTGAVISVDSLGSPFGFDDFGSQIVADKRGNYFVGGQFSAELDVPADTLYSVGGYMDFCIYKYGYDNCNCTPNVASFTYAGSSTITFTYTGTMVGVDSMVWNFGDGTTATSFAPTHIYTTADSYYVCVNVYSSCGMATQCNEVHVTTTSVNTISSAEIINVFPNPANNSLTITSSNEKITNVVISDLLGQTVLNKNCDATILQLQLSGLAKGIYFIKINNSVTRKFVKE